MAVAALQTPGVLVCAQPFGARHSNRHHSGGIFQDAGPGQMRNDLHHGSLAEPRLAVDRLSILQMFVISSTILIILLIMQKSK